jgi:hypothetical protein
MPSTDIYQGLPWLTGFKMALYTLINLHLPFSLQSVWALENAYLVGIGNNRYLQNRYGNCSLEMFYHAVAMW